jgi:hypothetical protein
MSDSILLKSETPSIDEVLVGVVHAIASMSCERGIPSNESIKTPKDIIDLSKTPNIVARAAATLADPK